MIPTPDITEFLARADALGFTIPNGATPHESETEPNSWQPLDLGPYLRGEVKRPEPIVGIKRRDGVRFIYPGKEHAVIGEMESGKSWFALGCVAAELVERHHVIYVHFEEADPSDTVERLLALGVQPHLIEEYFHFVAPDRPIAPEWVPALLEPVPTLVVLDGVNEGMALHGQGVRDEDGAAQFRRRLVKPFIAAGSAVLSADHVVKDSDKRGRYALGSIHKGNALSGALILLENAEPFGRGQKGASHVFVTKDRPGHLRRHGRPDKKIPGKTFMGVMVVDDTREWVNYLDLTIVEPVERDQDEAAGQANPGDDEKVMDTVATLQAEGVEANVRAVRAHCGMSKDRCDNALTRLTTNKRLTETSGPRGARIFDLVTVAQDQPGSSAA